MTTTPRWEPEKWDRLIKKPLWYEKLWPMISEMFVSPPEETTKEWRAKWRKILWYFTDRLTKEQVALGDRDEFFNDDDRWTAEKGYLIPLDRIIIHHTAMTLTYAELNALHLLRLYVPLYMNSSAFKVDGVLQPISSGHFRRGKQTFAGYHYMVYPNGWWRQILDHRYVGLQCGNYKMNCRSIAIAFVGNHTNVAPTLKAINSARRIIRRLNFPKDTQILGHCEVREDTICPGHSWKEWKPEILINLQFS